jgi:hypothetical protein
MKRELSIPCLLLGAAMGLGAPIAQADDGLDIHFYGDAAFTVQNHSAVSNSFAAADFDLFPTYSIGRLSFLAEVLFQGDTNNNLGIDIDRAQASYLFSEALRVRGGRMHTSFGYYNDAYHQGKLFILATDRPLLAEFSDTSGLLMNDDVGIAVDGKLTAKLFDFHYDLEVGNGRGKRIGEVPVSIADKSGKMVNLRLRLLPSFVDGLILGGNVLYDEVPPDPAAAALPPGAPVPNDGSIGVPNMMHEIDVGVHLVYLEKGFHFIAEGALIQHREPATSRVFNNQAGFVEVGKALGDFTPYVRFEHVSLDPKGDPLYQTSPLANAGFVDDLRVGVKWLFNDHLAVKLEGAGYQSRLVPSRQSATVQVAYGF